MKILYIVNGFGAGRGISGGDIRVVEIAKRLVNKFDINVLTTPVGRENLLENGLEARYYVIPLPSIFRIIEQAPFGRTLSYLAEIIITVMMKTHFLHFDIVYTSSDFLVDIIPALYYKKRKIAKKWVSMIHHLYDMPWRRQGNFLLNILGYFSQQLAFRLIKEEADTIFVYKTPEGACIKQLLTNLGFPKRRISYVANGVDYDLASQVPDQNKKFTACFAAGLRESKGIFDLVSIWKQVCTSRRDATLIVVGSGRTSEIMQVMHQIKRHELSMNIRLLGYIPHSKKLYRWFKSSEIFVAPSYEEGWGIAVCEAMACGLPVVAYDLQAYKIFEDAIIRVPIGDRKAFAEAIIKLLSNEKLRRTLGKKARRIALRLDWNEIAKEEWRLLHKSFAKA